MHFTKHIFSSHDTSLEVSCYVHVDYILVQIVVTNGYFFVMLHV